MKNIIRDIFLVCAMGAVAIMCVGLALYEYVPSGLTIARASQYEKTEETAEILSDAKEVQDLLAAQAIGSSATANNSPIVRTNIILKEYDVSKADLARYRAVGSYVQGRSDPFAEVPAEPTVNGGGATGVNVTGNQSGGNTTTNTTASDGTFYNTARTK